MFALPFKKKAKIEERRREMALEVAERRYGQELLNRRVAKLLASKPVSPRGGKAQSGGSRIVSQLGATAQDIPE